MKVKLTLSSQLTKEELQRLIRGIRLCGRALFPDKEISIWIKAPELTMSECVEILTRTAFCESAVAAALSKFLEEKVGE